ncbi:DinB family protein [Daejeonella sp. JGW-45]|uniref:DinB family protein n=1 Tax=Daejeonella sp. JGW-45 TaxID=3034148 RepID=UPI0023EC94A3|nr:DinB family protein [Daejeonella sp. JGW-45]
MSVSSHVKSLVAAVEKYEKLLAEVSEETFTRTPPDGSWSYSETFSHIFQSNLVSLIAVEKCFLGTGVFCEKRLSFGIWAILFIGRLPPGKYKAPDRLASMVKKISKEDAANLIVKFRSRLADLKGKANKADRYQAVKHPRLGLLNAKQWIRFIEIHTIHHTRQLKRIEAQLTSARQI